MALVPALAGRLLARDVGERVDRAGLRAVDDDLGLGALLSEPKIIVYGAKTGTIDSLADIARKQASCESWNERHPRATQLECGKTPPDDSLFVIAFGVVTSRG